LTSLLTARDVSEAAAACCSLSELDGAVVHCRACPRLVSWREEVARDKRRAFADDDYWGRPVPGFGDPSAPILVVGLAPAAHGANRTGRMFTGDRSGDWLYAALCRAGLANQPASVARDDGLELRGVRITAAVRCAPPQNQPTPDERDTCSAWLDADLRLVGPRVIVALGAFAWRAVLGALARAGEQLPRPRPAFGHLAEMELPRQVLIGSFHPSQQNTFTGKLTAPMLDRVFTRARSLAGLDA
jgi:uracil-DNA glycosylase